MNIQEMQKLSVKAQIKKYGGKKAYREEMARRGKKGGRPKTKLDKNDINTDN